MLEVNQCSGFGGFVGGAACTTDDLITPAGEGNTYTRYPATGTIANIADGTSATWAPTWFIGTDAWIKCEFPAAVLVTRMSWRSGPNTDWNAANHWSDEKMQGSDNDSDWTDLNVESGSPTYAPSTDYVRTFSNATPYKYLRWLWVDQSGGHGQDWEEIYAYCTYL